MKAVFISILLSLSLAGHAQRQYFVLIESENRQPIFVRIGETTYNSSSVGHVILSGMVDSVYNMEIGFPKDQYPSNHFLIKMNKKDHGYQLKNLPDKGWVLFNYQTAELVYPVKKEGIGAQSGYNMVKRNDGFARLLSQVVNDTAVLYSIVYEKPLEAPPKSEPVVKTESKTPKIETVAKSEPVVKAESKTPKTDTLATRSEEVLKEPVEVPKQIKAVPIVTKVEEKQSDSGKHITYLDNHDSVKIFIGIEQAAPKQNADEVLKEPKKEVTDSQVLKEDKAVVPVIASVDKTRSEDIKKPEEIKKNEEVKKPDETKKTELKEDPPPKPVEKEVKDTAVQQKKVVIYNSDCKAIAWDNDVDKLRIKMLGAKDVDDKISIARKIFKTKCFTAAQIKALTELFVTDQDKYKFLDAAYPFALDTENFKQLSYLLTDDYYVKRFRTMVRLD